jgi:hypothetical protein
MNPKRFSQLKKGHTLVIQGSMGKNQHLRSASITKIEDRGERIIRIRYRDNSFESLYRKDSARITAVDGSPTPSVVVDQEGIPTCWENWLTLRPLWDILIKQSRSDLPIGESVPRKVLTKSSDRKHFSVDHQPPVTNDSLVSSKLYAKFGVLKVTDYAPSDSDLRSIKDLRSVYVEIDPNHPIRSIDIAASLVDPLRNILKTSIYPVVVGPIRDHMLRIADLAYDKALRVTRSDFEQYIQGEGLIRGPAANIVLQNGG